MSRLTPTQARNILAERIRIARGVNIKNDPQRDYRQQANECRKGNMSYNMKFGIGKVPKPTNSSLARNKRTKVFE